MIQGKIENRKGLTLGELLIVIGIIAVLTAVALPVFSKHLERAREAYDMYTMRQAASAAIELYYAGVIDEASAGSAGLMWWPNGGGANANAAGVYDPASGTFLPRKSDDTRNRPYGKGTKRDGGAKLTMGNDRGAYAAKEDYSRAVVMVSIYPNGNNKHVDVYWKNVTNPNKGKYVGGQNGGNANDPKYSIRIPLE